MVGLVCADERTARQWAAMCRAERWLIDSGSRLRLESFVPHRMAVLDRFVQWARWRREKQLLKYGHLLRRTPRRFRRPR